MTQTYPSESGILTTLAWHKIYRHVCTMYVQSLSMYSAMVQQLTDIVYTNIENHKYVQTCTYISADVYTHILNMSYTALNIQVYTLYVHVYMIQNTYIIV